MEEKGKKWPKWNILWWFDNEHDPMPPERMHLWENYKPWIRYLLWRLRNPMHNFCYYVLGVADKEFLVTGDYPSSTFIPTGTGYNRLTLTGTDGSWTRKFVSYRGPKWEWYYGWNHDGRWGLALRHAHAK